VEIEQLRCHGGEREASCVPDHHLGTQAIQQQEAKGRERVLSVGGFGDIERFDLDRGQRAGHSWRR
jgi:hypothetical protein